MITLNTPIENISPIAEKIAAKLKKLGIKTAWDLLHYFPFRWEDWTKIKLIKDIEPSTSATIKGQIELIQNKRSKWKKKLVTEAIITDGTDQIKAVWFHQPYLIQNLHPGDRLYLSGKTSLKEDGLQFVHPNYEKITRYKTTTNHTARIVPVYPLTKKITAKQLRFLISKIIHLAGKIQEWLPSSIIAENQLNVLPLAIKQIHFPDSQSALNQAKDRIKFDELFILQLRASLAKIELKKANANPIKFQEKQTKKFVQSLPFKLTDSQKIAGWEIIKDIDKNIPMNRLLEGDVGSGKTVVACLAILNTALNNYQVAYMAPTEILAKQHFTTFCGLFKNLPIRIALLTSNNQCYVKNTKISYPAKISDCKQKRKNIYQLISSGEIDLAIGTHALIQDRVIFNNLSLVIIDEQHRFGVSQRKALKQKNKESSTVPHFLSMTATPIPRSLAMTAYGDLDLSIINEMPKDRKRTITEFVPPEKRPEKYKFILEEIKKGRQSFIICPLIDSSDKLGVKAVKDEYKRLTEKIFPYTNIGLMHGQLKPKDKEKVMTDFLANKTSILVSTPVIEVGIDVPNATIMLIESAERFGLAGLHQFRGRVGRSKYQSYCFLLTESDTKETIERMHSLIQFDNGFELAEKDLEFRGPGEIYGIRQSGYHDQFKMAKLTDYAIIKKSKKSVNTLLGEDPKLLKYPLILKKIKEFETSIHLE
ncbi:DNA helicase RecG [Candidatus Kuenenbacteria bacterium CG08_land_8_20_14_0_20_37_23]|uniref:ATP-dependent DNA helicase RecG n=1 Tax=Candidatus Kuenenbacteria bacterium CG08_land_8_20_14_0_20_37_23 TaxID=1974617 RepID=A0A2M6XTL2_9BACT|nr:MAG: DNA helicase RecG [Candidatus Kuenenbacteria bacterium CG08_land_8_20_14_0_20_37_23]